MPGGNNSNKKKKNNSNRQKTNSTSEEEQQVEIADKNEDELTEKEKQQQEIIEKLLQRVEALENRVQLLESSVTVTKTTSDNLKVMLDNQQQYSRRPCMVVTGMMSPGNEVSNTEDAESVLSVLSEESGIDKDIIKQNVDKIHPIGEIVNDKQQRIVKFTTDNFKEKIYLAQKERKKREPRRRTINFKPSLTRRRSKMLANANQKIENNEAIKFVSADMHGSLKIVLQNPLKRKYVHSFNTEAELDKIISKLENRDDVSED